MVTSSFPLACETQFSKSRLSASDPDESVWVTPASATVPSVLRRLWSCETACQHQLLSTGPTNATDCAGTAAPFPPHGVVACLLVAWQQRHQINQHVPMLRTCLDLPATKRGMLVPNPPANGEDVPSHQKDPPVLGFGNSPLHQPTPNDGKELFDGDSELALGLPPLAHHDLRGRLLEEA